MAESTRTKAKASGELAAALQTKLRLTGSYELDQQLQGADLEARARKVFRHDELACEGRRLPIKPVVLEIPGVGKLFVGRLVEQKDDGKVLVSVHAHAASETAYRRTSGVTEILVDGVEKTVRLAGHTIEAEPIRPGGYEIDPEVALEVWWVLLSETLGLDPELLE